MGARGPQPIKQLDDIAIFLRGKGKTYKEIGSILSVSKERAWARVNRVVNSYPQESGEGDLTEVNR
jgi:DNA-binding CsgD family transcriptional regulator